jgi:hypothetical protein
VVLIPVDRLDRSVLKAIAYARAIDASEIRAFHAAVDVPRAHELLARWAESGIELGVPLEIAECADRNVHDRTSRAIARSLAKRAHVDVVTVPYRIGRPEATGA